VPRAPLATNRADDAEARGDGGAGASKGEDECANPDRRRVGERGDGHLGFVDLEDGQIGARIAAGESRGDRRAVGERDGDVFLALDRVMRRDDDAGPPVDAGRGDTSPGVNRDDGLACAVDGAGEVV